jgi:phosphate uptake regulator
VISLPKTWLRSNNIDKGDWVSILPMADGSLFVYPSNGLPKEVRSISIKLGLDESEASMTRKIIGAYMDGYTLISLISEKIFTVSQQTAIRRISSTLYMMIIESEASSITLEALIDDDRASVLSGVERIHLITYSMFRDTIKALKNGDKTLAESVLPLENDVDQLMFFLMRLIRSCALDLSLGNRLGLDSLDCLDYQNLVQSIERVADHISTMAKSIVELVASGVKLTGNVSESLIKAAEVAFSSYDLAVRCFQSSNVEPTNEIIDSELIINNLCGELTPMPMMDGDKSTSALSYVVSIRESIKRISQYASDVAEMTIDRTYKNTQN